MELSTQHSETATVQLDNKLNIVFQSALDQWTEPINQLFGDEENIKVVEWDMKMHSMANEIDSSNYKEKKLQPSISNYSTSDFLHVFVAPITWAAKFRIDGKFKIIGPAFGSNSDIGIYAKKNLQHRSDGIAKIGIIDDDITSNILFQLYHLLLKEQFKTNIYEIVKEHAKTNKEKYEVEGYEYEPAINPLDRLSRLCLSSQDGDSFDFAIFTNRDFAVIKREAPEESNKIRRILKIDPIISHFFNQDYMPRSVYCIQETQYDRYKTEIKNLFQNIRDKTQKMSHCNGLFSLDPYNETDKKIQENIIKISKNKGILQTSDLKFLDLLTI
jgi:hypothetical protein